MGSVCSKQDYMLPDCQASPLNRNYMNQSSLHEKRSQQTAGKFQTQHVTFAGQILPAVTISSEKVLE